MEIQFQIDISDLQGARLSIPAGSSAIAGGRQKMDPSLLRSGGEQGGLRFGALMPAVCQGEGALGL